MEKYFIALLSFLLSYPLQGQFSATIRSGRPGQSIGAYTVGKNVFQLQSGIDFLRLRLEDDLIASNTFLSNNVLRYGLLEHFEVSGVINWRHDKFPSTPSSMERDSRSGVSVTQLGFRYNIIEQKGAIPGVCIQYRFLLRAQSEAYRRERLGSVIVAATSHKLSDRFGLITNLGAIWDGNDAGPTGSYTVALSYSFSEKLGGFVENFGFFTGEDFDTNIDFGLAWLVNPDLQLDIYGGWQGEQNIIDYFASAGVSWRFHHRDH